MRIPYTILALALGAGSPLAAQVGHTPASSPYQDILRGKSVTFLYGDIGGDGGRIGVGPHHGPSYGARFDVRVSGPLQFGVSLSRAKLERLVVSAADSVKTRVKGPVDQDLTMIELALQLNLTGSKTWHHLAPYVAGGVGYAHGSSLPAGAPRDSSGYNFGGKLYIAPTAGVRIFLGQTVHLRLEARQLFWKLSYPLSY
ncbi:MAG TPA: hypothetical protein VNH46_02985, partial [Gemmatimonadales bacterium]|nr:hypothetical protein [Gemmatimonadales bacterium]